MKWLGVLLLVKTVYSASHNPDENSDINDPNLFEGDMILSKEQIRRAEAGEDIDSSRKRGSSRFRKWPNGVVSYVIHSSLGRYSRAVTAIKAGMAEWTTKTCIRFKKRTNERAYVLFRSGSGCASSVGRTGSRQSIYLASGCWTRGVVGHEIGHAVGFYHEQSRPDRDEYIRVIFGNIRSGASRNFRKYPRSTIDSLGTKYDYGSLMHYGGKAFSRNGRPTIVVKRPGAVIGQRRGLSSIDAHQANLLYKAQCEQRGEGNMCSNYKVLSSADRSQGYTAQNNVRCDQRDLPTVSGWYRFMGAAGNQMADSCVPVRRCGTHATGWLSGNHPSVADGVVTRKVCYHWSNNCCRFSNNIRVKNCGDFFVYELHWPFGCALRYCGKRGAEPTTKPPTPAPLPTTTATPLPVTSANCKDKSRTCSFWRQFCNRWPFVRRLCNKTCSVC